MTTRFGLTCKNTKALRFHPRCVHCGESTENVPQTSASYSHSGGNTTKTWTIDFEVPLCKPCEKLGPDLALRWIIPPILLLLVGWVGSG